VYIPLYAYVRARARAYVESGEKRCIPYTPYIGPNPSGKVKGRGLCQQ